MFFRYWITDKELKDALIEMLDGQAENFGVGIWKKRLNANRHGTDSEFVGNEGVRGDIS